MHRSWLLTATLALLLPTAATAIPLQFQRALGGEAARPLQVGDIAYVPTGAMISVYDYSVPTAPVLRHRTDRQPARGIITGVSATDTHLYASYFSAEEHRAGVAVYSLADPAQPRLLNQVEDYTDSAFREPRNVLVHGGRLYLFDAQTGVYVSSLADPVHPAFVLGYWGGLAATDVSADGDRLYAAGRDFLFMQSVTILGLADPDAPEWIGGFSADGSRVAGLDVGRTLSAGFGFGIELYDTTDPEMPFNLGSFDDGVSMYFSGVLLPDRAVALGDEQLHVYDTSAPTRLAAPAAFPIDTYLARQPLHVGSDVLVATRADRLLRVGLADPDQPVLLSDEHLAGTATPFDIAFNRGRAYILSQDVGLQVGDASTLAPVHSHVLPVPAVPSWRAYESLEVRDDIAFVTSWGSGLFMVDLSSPEAPQDLGFLPYGYAAGLAVIGNTAFVGRVTNGGEVISVDVSDPSAPKLLDAVETVKAMGLAASPSHVFVADARSGPTPGGLRAIDANDPGNLVDVDLYNEDCGSATEVLLSADAETAYVACDTGLHIVDVSSPEEMVRLGMAAVTAPSAPLHALAVSGDRAWYGTSSGITEIDISDPAAPTVLRALPLPWFPQSLRVAPDGRLFALTGIGGLHVFAVQPELFSDGFE